MIIDTDIGGDPDDALALAAAARHVPALALVLTADETAGAAPYGERARLARWLLDDLGRGDVAVAAGADYGGTKYYCAAGLVPDTVPAQTRDVVAAVRAVFAAAAGPVRWVGMAPMGNLARFLREAPDLAGRIRLTQMGGALDYRDRSRAEHNIRLDVEAARQVLHAAAEGHLTTPDFVTSDVTFHPDMEVSADHPIHRMLAAPGAPAWAGVLAAHLDRWYADFHPASKQHDALALATALHLPFVDSDRTRVVLDGIGRMSSPAQGGTTVWMSLSAEYGPFMTWLADRLDPARPAAGPAGTTSPGA